MVGSTGVRRRLINSGDWSDGLERKGSNPLPTTINKIKTMKLVAFGCSYTYGSGLEDCYIESTNSPGPSPSEKSWPSILGSDLGIPVVNKSKPGCSNGFILNEILNYSFNIDDIVCVMWTFKNRDVKFNIVREPDNLGWWVKEWYKYQDVFDLNIKNYLHIHHAYLYLKSKGISSYFLNTDFNHNLTRLEPPWIKDVSFISLDFKSLTETKPLALDNIHPGPAFHIAVSNKLKINIKENLFKRGL